jgi:mRNA guanylyltransferase
MEQLVIENCKKIDVASDFSDIQSRFIALLSSTKDKRKRDNDSENLFPGAESVRLCRRDFSFLKKNQYWVCEKSQGFRVLVLFLSEDVYFYDELGSIHRIGSDHFFIPSLTTMKPQENTLFDAEITYNFHYEKYCLMILDVMYVEGERVVDLSLSKRLNAIRDKIIVPFRSKYPQDSDQSSLPLVLLGKEYVKINNVNKIFDNIKHFSLPREEEGSGHRFLYQNGKRYNDSDGLLFAPEDKEYKPWKCISLKKWKYPYFSTVDFCVKVSKIKGKPCFKFFIQGPGRDRNLMEYRNIFFSKECASRLQHDLQDDTEAIVECNYDSQNVGEWVYYRIKHNKNIPDSYATICQILENVSENILKEDIIKNFCPIIKPIERERPQTTPHKPIYPNSEERSGVNNLSPPNSNERNGINNISPPKGMDYNNNGDEMSPESYRVRLDESSPRKDVIYESPKKDSPDAIVGKKRKLDEYSDDESSPLKKARIGE